jgi:hypothetical protein
MTHAAPSAPMPTAIGFDRAPERAASVSPRPAGPFSAPPSRQTSTSHARTSLGSAFEPATPASAKLTDAGSRAPLTIRSP